MHLLHRVELLCFLELDLPDLPESSLPDDVVELETVLVDRYSLISEYRSLCFCLPGVLSFSFSDEKLQFPILVSLCPFQFNLLKLNLLTFSETSSFAECVRASGSRSAASSSASIPARFRLQVSESRSSSTCAFSEFPILA